jgi:chromosomal replication initiation ATPase DnaA
MSKILNTDGKVLLSLTPSEIETITNAALASDQQTKDLVYKAIMNEAHRIMSLQSSRERVAAMVGEDFIVDKVAYIFEGMVSSITGCNHILSSVTRHQQIVYARSLLIFLLRTQFKSMLHLCPLALIGSYFVPRKDHSTIIHCYRKIVNGYCYDSRLRQDLDVIKQMCIDMNRFDNVVKEIEKMAEGYAEVKAIRDKNRIHAY